MRLRTTLLLLGSTLALLAYIFLHERHMEDSRAAAVTSSRVHSFDPDAAKVVRIDGQKGKSMFRKGKDGIWMMLHPLKDRADQQLLSSLVRQAADMAIMETMTLGEMRSGDGGGRTTPEDIGFGAEETRVTILAGDTTLASFAIGDPTEFKDVHYVALDGEWSDEKPVLAVLSRLFETAELPMDKLRDPRLIPATADDLHQIKFAEKPTSLMLRRDILSEDGSAYDPEAATPDSGAPQPFTTTPWRLVQPIDTRTDKAIVDDRIAALLGVGIVGFSDETAPPSDEGELQDGMREILVWTFGARTKTIIELSDSPEAETGGYLLARVTGRPGTLRISRDILKAFTVNPNDLRDRHLAAFEFASVLTIDLRGHAPDGRAEPPVVLARHGSNFMLLRNGKNEKADAEKVKQLIRALNNEVVEFVADSDANPVLYGLDRPIRLVTITTDTPDPEAPAPPPGQMPKLVRKSFVLRIGEGPKPVPTALGRLYASFEDSPFVYGISPELLGMLEPQIIRWKSPELLRFSLFDLKGITLRRPPQPPLEITYDPTTNGWSAQASGRDVSGVLDPAKNRAFSEALGFLRASGWTADPARALQRIREETILDITARVMNHTEGKVEDVRIRIAPPSPGLTRSVTYYGQINDIPDVFLLDRETFDRLNANLIQAPVPPAPTVEGDAPPPPCP